MVTSSINLHSIIGNAIASQVNTSLGEAASEAEHAAGNNLHAIAAHVGETNGYLTYRVWVLGPDMSVNMVIVDPGTGQVLSNRQGQHPMMAGMMSMGPGMEW